MGEVYRARDSRLHRDVAIKALPEEFAKDPGRLARFEREARVLASLSHPNIAAIYGLEEAGGAKFLVLECVEGETLGERLASGPLSIDEALSVCAQIARGARGRTRGRRDSPRPQARQRHGPFGRRRQGARLRARPAGRRGKRRRAGPVPFAHA